MAPRATQLRTTEGLTIYDLQPEAADLWAVAGPAGCDPATINPDHLPAGFRWISSEDWQQAKTACGNCGAVVWPEDDLRGCGCHCPKCGNRL